MVGSRFFVFGGQVDGEFLNDLWSFDLNSRKSYLSYLTVSIKDQILMSLNHSSVRTKATWELVEPAEGSPRPPKRTSHICVTFGEKIILYVSSVYLSAYGLLKLAGKLWWNGLPVPL